MKFKHPYTNAEKFYIDMMIDLAISSLNLIIKMWVGGLIEEPFAFFGVHVRPNDLSRAKRGRC